MIYPRLPVLILLLCVLYIRSALCGAQMMPKLLNDNNVKKPLDAPVNPKAPVVQPKMVNGNLPLMKPRGQLPNEKDVPGIRLVNEMRKIQEEDEYEDEREDEREQMTREYERNRQKMLKIYEEKIEKLRIEFDELDYALDLKLREYQSLVRKFDKQDRMFLNKFASMLGMRKKQLLILNKSFHKSHSSSKFSINSNNNNSHSSLDASVAKKLTNLNKPSNLKVRFDDTTRFVTKTSDLDSRTEFSSRKSVYSDVKSRGRVFFNPKETIIPYEFSDWEISSSNMPFSSSYHSRLTSETDTDIPNDKFLNLKDSMIKNKNFNKRA